MIIKVQGKMYTKKKKECFNPELEVITLEYINPP